MEVKTLKTALRKARAKVTKQAKKSKQRQLTANYWKLNGDRKLAPRHNPSRLTHWGMVFQNLVNRKSPKPLTTKQRQIVRARAKDLLTSSPGFRALSAERRQQIANDLFKVGSYLAESPAAGPKVGSDLVEDVDFPEFVADLLKGTFQAIVDASIQQMRA